MKKLLVILVLGLFFGNVQAEELRVLTYDSMLGKGSLGETIETEFKKQCEGCSVKFVTTKDLWSLFQKLKKDLSPQESRVDYHAVLGISGAELNWAKKRKWIDNAKAFEWSPFAILYDSTKIPSKDLPQQIKDLPEKLKTRLLVQDPRLSQAGLGWLEFLFQNKPFELSALGVLRPRYFPSWSSSYESFFKGIGGAVWTYQTSLFYHSCNDGPEINQKIKLLKLSGVTFPNQVNFFAPLNEKYLKKFEPTVKKFENLLLSPLIQGQVLSKNWMLPANSDVEFPECVVKAEGYTDDLKKPPTLGHLWSEEEFKKSLDLWSAQ